MSKPKHTPGPWKIGTVGRGRAGRRVTVYGKWIYAGDKPVAMTARDTRVNTLQGIADARLIAAAPDLIAACKAVLHAIENADMDGVVLWIRPPHAAHAVHETALERLMSVIELAEGTP